MKRTIALLISYCFALQATAQDLKSPNSNFTLEFKADAEGIPTYSLNYKNKPIINPSKLGFDLVDDTDLITDFQFKNQESTSFDETWKPTWGAHNEIRNNYNEIACILEQKVTSRVLIVRFRLFNDGLGFRYELPEQENLTHFSIAEERTQFAMTGDHKTFWTPGNFTNNEFNYTTSKLSEIRGLMDSVAATNVTQKLFSKTGVQTTLMMKSAEGIYINIHEAAVVDNASMHLELDDENLVFESILTSDTTSIKAQKQAPYTTPWRTIIASDNATDILHSTLHLNLNEPSVSDNTNWTKPVKYISVWWEMITEKSSWAYSDVTSQLGESDSDNSSPSKRLHAANNTHAKYDRYMNAFQYVKDVPVNWEDIKVLEAEPGEYVTFARKEKGTNNWFIGNANSEIARNSIIDFSFLPKVKQYVATFYVDGKDAPDDPNTQPYVIEKYVVSSKTKHTQHCAPSGGYAISLMEVTNRKETKGLKKLKGN